jgi:pimeloyl-ACP methyl ester carboxylesterase
MATFVLVHGACVGGWCWRWVAPLLREFGHEVHTPTLTGLGERMHLASPEINLDTHIQDIVNVLDFEDLTDVVLVGWSYGGMIVAGVAGRVPERIGHVIYFDSDVPRDGDTSAPESNHAARTELARLHGDGWRVPPQPHVFEPSLATLPDETRQWITARFVPHLLRTWTEPIRVTGAGGALPTTYIRATVGYDADDEDTQRQDARINSEPSWTYRELAESHFAVWAAPKALADALVEAIKRGPRASASETGSGGQSLPTPRTDPGGTRL